MDEAWGAPADPQKADGEGESGSGEGQGIFDEDAGTTAFLAIEDGDESQPEAVAYEESQPEGVAHEESKPEVATERPPSTGPPQPVATAKAMAPNEDRRAQLLAQLANIRTWDGKLGPSHVA